MNVFIGKQYLKYLISSRHYKGFGIHSPFVFKLVNEVFYSDIPKKDMRRMQNYRKEVLASSEKVRIYDMGAGSKIDNSETQTVSKRAKASSVSPKYGELLYRLTKYFKPQKILELGTAFGVSSSCLALGAPEAKLISIEANEDIYRFAKTKLEASGIQNMTLINDSFDHVFSTSLDNTDLLDFVFVDGNHSYQATLNYFDQCLSKHNVDTILVFDDIHWSDGMQRAWNQICRHPAVSISIDLFQMGLVFFKTGICKQNFIIRY